MPLFRAHVRDQRHEPSAAAATQFDEVICHALSPDGDVGNHCDARTLPNHNRAGRSGSTGESWSA